MQIIRSEFVDGFNVKLINDDGPNYRIVGSNSESSTYVIHLTGTRVYAEEMFNDHITQEEEYV